CFGSRRRVLRIKRSSVPWRRSDGFGIEFLPGCLTRIPRTSTIRNMRTIFMILACAIALGVAAATAVAPPQTKAITFSENIAPIIYENCVTCHRSGEAAPFSLISYDDVKKRGALIATVTRKRYMPPWHAAHGYGEFAEERRLTDEQIAA